MAEATGSRQWWQAFALPFGKRPGDGELDSRVVDLFRNRAELKKVLASAQDEVLQLKDRIKQQEGATARVQEMLQLLEERLASAESAFPVLAFYHLRALWSHARELIAVLTRELAAQRDERERRQFLADYNRRRFEARREIEQACSAAQQALLAAGEAERAAHAELARLNRWWHYFRRRTAQRRLHVRSLQVQGERLAVQEAQQQRERFEADTPPEFGGLSLESRRSINLAAMAYAQALHDRLSASGLYLRAAEASRLREPPERAYGPRAACEQLISDVQRARAVLDDRSSMRAEIGRILERLKQLAVYRSASESVPTAAPDPARTAGVPSVLAEELWGLQDLLLR